MAAAIGSEALTASLAESTALVAQALEDNLPRTGCRLLARASAQLDRLPDDPSTLPDRDGIRLILGIATLALANTESR